MSKKKPPRKRRIPRHEQEFFGAMYLAFARKYGRKPEPSDPFFFDPGAEGPTPVPADDFTRAFLQGLLSSKAGPQIVYAYMRTGFIVTEVTKDTLPKEQVAEWDAAIDEFLAFLDKGEVTEH